MAINAHELRPRRGRFPGARYGSTMLFASTVAFGVALLTSGTVRSGEPHESLRGRGIFSAQPNGFALYLFADVHHCGPDQRLPVAQILVSTDGGATWEKQGPALDGSEIQYVQNTVGGLMVAGLHVAEGPGVDPFLLVPGDKRFQWELHGIVDGPSELVGVGQTSSTDFLAWIRPVDAGREGPRRPIVTYRSRDGGRVWTPAAGSSPEGARGPIEKFGRVTPRSGAWRIADRRDGGFDVRHREPAGWRTVKAFPWSTCEAGGPSSGSGGRTLWMRSDAMKNRAHPSLSSCERLQICSVSMNGRQRCIGRRDCGDCGAGQRCDASVVDLHSTVR